MLNLRDRRISYLVLNLRGQEDLISVLILHGQKISYVLLNLRCQDDLILCAEPVRSKRSHIYAEPFQVKKSSYFVLNL